MEEAPMTWTEVEMKLTTLPRRRATAVGVRAVERALRRIAVVADDYGPEVWEWVRAMQAALEAVQRYAADKAVSRFTLDLAAEICRGTANSAAATAQLVGPSRGHEVLESVIASAAFTADAARTRKGERVPGLLTNAMKNAHLGGEASIESVADLTAEGDFGPLWPHGEMEWYRSGTERYHKAGLSAWSLPGSAD